MPSCVFRRCTNYDAKVNKQAGITYHSFPADEVRNNDWIRIVRNQRSEIDWTPSKSSKICSNHFKNEDKYVTKSGRTQLKNNAIPIVEGTSHDDDHENGFETTSSVVQTTSSQQQRINNGDGAEASNELASVGSDSDMEHIFDTPVEHALRRQLAKKNLQLRNHIRKMRNQQQTIERLKKRNLNLITIVKKLRTDRVLGSIIGNVESCSF